MLNIIFYSKNKANMKNDIGLVNCALVSEEIDYRIYQFFKIDDEFLNIVKDNKLLKVYILDITDALELELIANKIRENDIDSYMILITKIQLDNIFDYHLNILDLIDRNTMYDKRIKEDIKLVIKRIYKKKAFVFQYNHRIYRIMNSDINYIEKESQVKRCIIHTVGEEYYIVNSIERLTSILGNGFVKTHQSCIINTANVERINLAKNLIIFKNGDETSLLSNSMKKEIKKLELLK